MRTNPLRADVETLVTLDEPDIALRLQTSEASACCYEVRLSGLIVAPQWFGLCCTGSGAPHGHR